MMLNKRAVSPLIATVLLVMIVVSIGAAVMLVIQGIYQDAEVSVQQGQQQINCGENVKLGLIEASQSYRICINAPQTADVMGNVTLYLDNKGTMDISDWKVRVIGDDGLYEDDGGYASLDAGAYGGFVFLYNTSIGQGISEIEVIQISPKIPGAAGQRAVVCTEENLIWDGDAIAEFDLCNETTWDNSIT